MVNSWQQATIVGCLHTGWGVKLGAQVWRAEFLATPPLNEKPYIYVLSIFSYWKRTVSFFVRFDCFNPKSVEIY